MFKINFFKTFYILKQDDKTTILYHILYFEFTQNSGHSHKNNRCLLQQRLFENSNYFLLDYIFLYNLPSFLMLLVSDTF